MMDPEENGQSAEQVEENQTTEREESSRNLLKIPDVLAAIAKDAKALLYDENSQTYHVLDGPLFEEEFVALRAAGRKKDTAQSRPFSCMSRHYFMVQGRRWASTGTVFAKKTASGMLASTRGRRCQVPATVDEHVSASSDTTVEHDSHEQSSPSSDPPSQQESEGRKDSVSAEQPITAESVEIQARDSRISLRPSMVHHNQPGCWDVFISYIQREAPGEATTLSHQLTAHGKAVWLDKHMANCGTAAMREGVDGSEFFLCLLTDTYFLSEYCFMEFEWAVQSGRKLILAHSRGTDLKAVFGHARALGYAQLRDVESVELNLHRPQQTAATLAQIRERIRISSRKRDCMDAWGAVPQDRVHGTLPSWHAFAASQRQATTNSNPPATPPRACRCWPTLWGRRTTEVPT